VIGTRLARWWAALIGRGLGPDAARSVSTADTGQWGEREAARLLRRKGLRILGQRVRIGRRDEIDLVARDGATLVFVEVKTRRGESFGRPLAAVDRRKRHALSRAAVRYLRKLRRPPRFFRFDVVEVVGLLDQPGAEVRHIENAFTLDRPYLPPC